MSDVTWELIQRVGGEGKVNACIVDVVDMHCITITKRMHDGC